MNAQSRCDIAFGRVLVISNYQPTGIKINIKLHVLQLHLCYSCTFEETLYCFQSVDMQRSTFETACNLILVLIYNVISKCYGCVAVDSF